MITLFRITKARCATRAGTIAGHSLAVGLIALSCATAFRGTAQVHSDADTVVLTAAGAEHQFLHNNLQLLAARFNIDAAQAMVLQAGLWPNPNISIEQNLYNPFTKRYLDFTNDGNTDITVQQLVTLAGKRGKQIRLAELNADIAGQTFYDLLRSLKRELRTNIFDLYYLQQSLAFYDQSVAALRRTVASEESVLEKRSILLAEVLRVKALLLSLENERVGLLHKAAEIQENLHLLLRDSTRAAYRIHLEPVESTVVHPPSLEDAIEIALTKRPDVAIALSNVQASETNLSLQRALAVPDITIGGSWSRAGSYIPNYYAISIAVDLPLFNRNQGGIAQADAMLRASRIAYENTRKAVEKDVTIAYNKFRATDQLFRGLDPNFPEQYRELANGMTKTYENRNMSVIQFTDFFESYRTSIVQMNQIANDWRDAIEDLNFATGSDLIHTR